MKNPSKSKLPVKLARGRERFEKWRGKQKSRRRLPEHLWVLAAQLAREYGLNRTARTLRLDYNCLKKRIELAVSEKVLKPTATPQFLELLPSVAHATVECTLEREDAQGVTIRIHFKGRELPDLAALSRSLWSPDQ